MIHGELPKGTQYAFNPETDEVTFWRKTMSQPLKPDDPCYFMLSEGPTSTTTVFKKGCYICEDPEFAQMGLPMCYECKHCGGHVAADDTVCDDCGEDQCSH